MEEVQDKYKDYDYVNIYNVTENKWYEISEYSFDDEEVKEILAELNE